MRDSLNKLIKNTIIFQYELPNTELSIDKTIFSTEKDRCYSISDETDLVKIIYNAIVDYAFNEFDLEPHEIENLHTKALMTRLRYDSSNDETTQLKYGFFGEVLLHCILKLYFGTETLISKGYFYVPLSNSESHGYDNYHLIESEDSVKLWFGEVKFHSEYSGAISDILNKIRRNLSDDYLHKNLIAIANKINDLNVKGSKVEMILNQWHQNPTINIKELLDKDLISLVYPAMILFQKNKKGYEHSIRQIIEYIQRKFNPEEYDLSIPCSIFFILIPIGDVRKVKTEVLKWIESEQPLI